MIKILLLLTTGGICCGAQELQVEDLENHARFNHVGKLRTDASIDNLVISNNLGKLKEKVTALN